MKVTLTKEQESYVRSQVEGGQYLDAGDVVRDALRAHASLELHELPELEAAILDGVRSGHRAYDSGTLERVRTLAAQV